MSTATTDELVNMVADLAMEVNEGSQAVNFDELTIDKEATFAMMATHVVEGYKDILDGNITAMATITSLVVENFVFQLLLGYKTLDDDEGFK